MNMRDIKTIARERGVRPGQKCKDELVRTLQQQEGNPTCFATGQKENCGQMNCLWRQDCH